jgi:hypothetical protein
MNWTSKNKNQLLFGTVVAVLLVLIALSLMWLKLPLLAVSGGLFVLALPVCLALYAGNRKMTYVLLGLLSLVALGGLAMLINERSRLSTFEEACSKFNGSVLSEDFEYLCLNENQGTSALSMDMFSGPISSGAVVLYAGVFLVNAAYLFYLLVHFFYTASTKWRH